MYNTVLYTPIMIACALYMCKVKNERKMFEVLFWQLLLFGAEFYHLLVGNYGQGDALLDNQKEAGSNHIDVVELKKGNH